MDQKGLSLIEALIVILIISIVTTIAVPAWQQMMLRQSVNSIATRLQQLITASHDASLLRHHIVTLCGASDAIHCDGDWHHVISFIDPNKQRELPDTRSLLAQQQFKQAIHISLKAFPSKKYLSFDAKGLLNNSNGTFTVSSWPWQVTLTMSKAGRVTKKIEEIQHAES